jgi:hypothetical protein
MSLQHNESLIAYWVAASFIKLLFYVIALVCLFVIAPYHESVLVVGDVLSIGEIKKFQVIQMS